MYKIPVKIEAIEKRKKATDPLHMIAGFFLLGIGATLSIDFGYSFLAMLPVYIIALLSIFYGAIRRRLDLSGTYNHWVRTAQFLTFALLAINTIHVLNNIKISSLVVWGVVTLFLMFTERKVFHDTAITIKAEGLYMPGYFTSHLIPWTNINDLVLRNDFITVGKNNNKYLQLEVLKSFADDELDKINEYSSQSISNAAQNPIYT